MASTTSDNVKKITEQEEVPFILFHTRITTRAVVSYFGVVKLIN